MTVAKYSRGSTVDLEKCVENMSNNRFMLIVVGSARVREIARLNKHSERTEHRHPVVTVLKEIENGQLDISGIKLMK